VYNLKIPDTVGASDKMFRAFGTELRAFGTELRAFGTELRAFAERLRTFGGQLRTFEDRLRTFREGLSQNLIFIPSPEKRPSYSHSGRVSGVRMG